CAGLIVELARQPRVGAAPDAPFQLGGRGAQPVQRRFGCRRGDRQPPVLGRDDPVFHGTLLSETRVTQPAVARGPQRAPKPNGPAAHAGASKTPSIFPGETGKFASTLGIRPLFPTLSPR